MKKILTRSWCFTVFAAFVIVAIIPLSGVVEPSSGEASDSSNYERQTVSNEKVLPAEPENVRDERGSSTLWRSYIWEGLPAETLNGPEPTPACEAYQQNDWRPIFIDAHFELNQGAALLLARLNVLEDEAIDPRPFKLAELSQSLEKLDRSRSALKAADPGLKDGRAEFLSNSNDLMTKYEDTFRAASEADIKLTSALFLFSREMNPFLQKSEYQKVVSGEVPISEFLKDLEPKTFNYEALISAYQRYKKLAAQGTQQHVAMPSKVRAGESGNHIRDLQKRLHQEGFYSTNITGVYDKETQCAVKEFQAAHLLDPDGTLGRQTQEWLNVSFKDKADLIARALEAVRQSPSRAHSRFIRINIPQFTLEYYKDGKLQEAHRVVVGKASGKRVKFRGRMVGENQTPTLTSEIQRVILNPRWYVSDRIRLELEVESKSDPEWFAKRGYVSMNSRYPSGTPRLFQSPGPKNALGRVKFEFPNPYAVYLHDTPLKQLFSRTRRDFSHGCIRVDKAVELAERLLRDDLNPNAEKMNTIVTGPGSNQVFVNLSHPIPIFIEYIPVVTKASAQVVFAGDPYEILRENDGQKG